MAGKIRQPIDLDGLSRFIEKQVPEIKLPIDLKQFGFGQSNPTYQITARDGKKYVLRKKPPGKLVSKTAHKVEREYRVIHALEGTNVAVPKAFCLCEDERVVGTPFYIMEFLDGRIIEDASLPDVPPQERTEMWHDVIRTLARLHTVKPKDVGLEGFGKPAGFYNRQLATFSTISAAQARAVDVETHKPVGAIPHFNEMVEFFQNAKSQPKDRGTLIHGDFKIDNLVFHKTEPRVIGILDWEMATVGHPLSDLVNLTTPYTLAEAQTSDSQQDFNPGATPGLPTKLQLVEWYSEEAKWDPTPDLAWGASFGLFRGSVIIQGIAARYALRQASSAAAKEYAMRLQPFAEQAYQLFKKVVQASGWKAKL